jgi:hypothetical protein
MGANTGNIYAPALVIPIVLAYRKLYNIFTGKWDSERLKDQFDEYFISDCGTPNKLFLEKNQNQCTCGNLNLKANQIEFEAIHRT